jgi:hypothetical protein
MNKIESELSKLRENAEKASLNKTVEIGRKNKYYTLPYKIFRRSGTAIRSIKTSSRFESRDFPFIPKNRLKTNSD